MDGPAPDRHLEVIRAVLEIVAREAGAANPAETAHQLQILLTGGMIAAIIDERTAERVREMTELLLQRSR